jgi:hypothetical protein
VRLAGEPKSAAAALTTMRTYVRHMMGQSRYRPLRELEGAIARGELDFALAHAKEVSRERAAPLDLELALGLVALVASQQAHAYDAWALRWLARWLGESEGHTIEQAARVAAALAELPASPDHSLAAIRRLAGVRSGGAPTP